MNTTPDFPALVEPFKFSATPYEYKVTPLRECPLPDALKDCDTPEKVADYWKLHIATNPYFDPERECLAVLLLNTRRRVKGHQLVSTGTLDTLLISPTSVFRLAIMASAAAIVLCHNHPSGDSSPSSADIKTTRDLIRASQLLKIEMVDHVARATFHPCARLAIFISESPQTMTNLANLGELATETFSESFSKTFSKGVVEE